MFLLGNARAQSGAVDGDECRWWAIEVGVFGFHICFHFVSVWLSHFPSLLSLFL